MQWNRVRDRIRMPPPFGGHAFTKAFSLFKDILLSAGAVIRTCVKCPASCACAADLSITVTLTYLCAFSVSTDKLVRSIIPNLAQQLARPSLRLPCHYVTMTLTENKAADIYKVALTTF